MRAGARLVVRALLFLIAAAGPAPAAPPPPPAEGALRVAVFHAALSRQRPGELVRELERGSPALAAVVEAVAGVAPDLLLLSRIDWDGRGVALALLQERLHGKGHSMPHVFAAQPNAGLPAGVDLVGRARGGISRDVQGYGRFAGHGGMALLSRLPVDADAVQDHSALLWADLPEARLPLIEGAPYPSPAAHAVQRLASTGIWDVPVPLPGGAELRLLVGVSTPPLPDGPAGRNALRNAEEARFWRLYLDGWRPPGGASSPPVAGVPFVLLAHLNTDPERGLGDREALGALLAHPALQDPLASGDAAGASARLRGGDLRLSYVLPSAVLDVAAAGIHWPDAAAAGEGSALNAVVWVDIRLPPSGRPR